MIRFLTRPLLNQCYPHVRSARAYRSHSLAKDGATAQFQLGWDWVQPMPDRATGFLGSVYLDQTGSLALLDSTIQTIAIRCPTFNDCTMIRLMAMTRFEGFENALLWNTKLVLEITADWGESWKFNVSHLQVEDFQRELVVTQPWKVKLWWPHGVGVEEPAHLHLFSFLLRNVDGTVIDANMIRVGIRTIHTYLDMALQGQRFQINGKDIYLVGGNWITTDQALRYSASEHRYCNEISLHRYAGLNLIRVWGYVVGASLFH